MSSGNLCGLGGKTQSLDHAVVSGKVLKLWEAREAFLNELTAAFIKSLTNHPEAIRFGRPMAEDIVLRGISRDLRALDPEAIEYITDLLLECAIVETYTRGTLGVRAKEPTLLHDLENLDPLVPILVQVIRKRQSR